LIGRTPLRHPPRRGVRFSQTPARLFPTPEKIAEKEEKKGLTSPRGGAMIAKLSESGTFKKDRGNVQTGLDKANLP